MEIKPRQDFLLFDLFHLADYHHREALNKEFYNYTVDILRIRQLHPYCIYHFLEIIAPTLWPGIYACAKGLIKKNMENFI